MLSSTYCPYPASLQDISTNGTTTVTHNIQCYKNMNVFSVCERMCGGCRGTQRLSCRKITLKGQHKKPSEIQFPSAQAHRQRLHSVKQRTGRDCVREIWKYTHSPSEKPLVDRCQGQDFQKQTDGDGEKH